jgi:hypothetical protein
MRVALCRLQHYLRGGKTRISEPSNLVGMSSGLGPGIQTKIIDNGISPWQVQIEQFSPDVVAITAPTKDISGEYAPFVREMRGAGRIVILGGKSASINPDFYSKAYNPHIIVRGQGELVMRDLASRDFKMNRAIESPFFDGNIGDAAIFSSKKLLKLDDISFIRPYSLDQYGFVAYPNPTYGCKHECAFCVSDGKFTIKSPKRILDEFVYLVGDLRAEALIPSGGDFAVVPKHATEVIRRILAVPGLLDVYYEIETRVDSLTKAIEEDPSVWKEFFGRANVKFLLGIESFHPERLRRLLKYKSLPQANKQKERLDRILGFTKGTKAIILGHLIMHDPKVTEEEMAYDLRKIEKLIEAYPRQISFVPGRIFSILDPTDGSEANATYEAHGDAFFYPVKKTPFNLLLLLYFILAEPRATEEFEGVIDLEDHAKLTLRHVGILREAMSRIKEFLGKGRANSEEINAFARSLAEEHFPPNLAKD